MPGRTMLCLGVTFLLLVPGSARAQHGHGHGSGLHPHPQPGGHGVPLVGGAPAAVRPNFVPVGGFYAFFPTILTIGPPGFVAPFGWMPPPAMAGRGPLLPPPPPEIAARWANGKAQPAPPAKPDPARA